MPPYKDMQLTPHFRLSEFLGPLQPMPDPWVLNNLYRLATRLETLRAELKRPISITSGYRSFQHNTAIGGASQSYHTRGMAVDIIVEGMTPQALQAHLKNWEGGLGSYPSHTHVDIRPYKARWTGVSK